MKLPIEFPFDHIRAKKTLAEEKLIENYVKDNDISLITIEYERSEKKTMLGVTVVDFSFTVIAHSKNDKKTILFLSNYVIYDKYELLNLIDYVKYLSSRLGIRLTNKFYEDGYSYTGRYIKRTLVNNA